MDAVSLQIHTILLNARLVAYLSLVAITTPSRMSADHWPPCELWPKREGCALSSGRLGGNALTISLDEAHSGWKICAQPVVETAMNFVLCNGSRGVLDIAMWPWMLYDTNDSQVLLASEDRHIGQPWTYVYVTTHHELVSTTRNALAMMLNYARRVGWEFRVIAGGHHAN